MSRFALSVLMSALVIVVVMALSARSRTPPVVVPPRIYVDGQPMEVTPEERAQLAREGLNQMKYGKLTGFLRQALVAQEANYANIGKYVSDVSQIPFLERPANVTLIVPLAGDAGFRMTAVDNITQLQCDVFAGDSAHWAFGYAFDPRQPACGKSRYPKRGP